MIISENDEFDEAEIARRRDAVIKRMADTPPQPKTKPKSDVKAKGMIARAANKGEPRR
jgi:hypothetical protein